MCVCACAGVTVKHETENNLQASYNRSTLSGNGNILSRGSHDVT